MKKYVAAIFTYKGSLILQRRDESAPNNPNLLGFFGGRVEKDETPFDAIKREVSEETSLDVDTLQFAHVFDILIPINSESSEKGIDSVFSCELKTNNFVVKEGAGFEAYSLEDLLKSKDLAPFSRVIAERMATEPVRNG